MPDPHNNPPPQGPGRDAQFFRNSREKLNAGRPQDRPGGITNRTTRGETFVPDRPLSRSASRPPVVDWEENPLAPGSGVSVQSFKRGDIARFFLVNPTGLSPIFAYVWWNADDSSATPTPITVLGSSWQFNGGWNLICLTNSVPPQPPEGTLLGAKSVQVTTPSGTKTLNFICGLLVSVT